RVSPDRLMERCVARIVPLDLLRADALPPRGPAGGQVHPLAGDRRRGGDGEDQGAADGARTGGAPQSSRKHGTFHLSRGLIGAARVSDRSRRGSQIVAPVLLPGLLVVSRRARALLAVADGVDA